MEQLGPRKNTFTDWWDEDFDYELDDEDVNKILIVRQTPPRLSKHPGGDRTGSHESRARITADLAKAINDGLYYYEQDLWTGEEPAESSASKVSSPMTLLQRMFADRGGLHLTAFNIFKKGQRVVFFRP